MPRFRSDYSQPEAPAPTVEPAESTAQVAPVDPEPHFTTPQAERVYRETKDVHRAQAVETYHLSKREELAKYNQELAARAAERAAEERDRINPAKIAERNAAEKEQAEAAFALAQENSAKIAAAEHARRRANQERVKAEYDADQEARARLGKLVHAVTAPIAPVHRTPVRTCPDLYCAVPLDGTPHKPYCAEHLRGARD